MKGRKTAWWFDDDEGPMVAKESLDAEWEDPTFDEVCVDMDGPDESARFVPAGQALSEGLRQLTEKQQFVIDRAWGLTDGQVYSFRQIGQAMGISGSMAKQHYDAGMKKLRKHLDS